MADDRFVLQPIGIIRSELKLREGAPRQGNEGAPDAWIDVDEAFAQGLYRIAPGDGLIVLTWLHLSARDVLQVHPSGEIQNPLTGVFATRSPNRPNPIGLHRVTVREIDSHSLKVGPIEAIDGTPVIDMKSVLSQSADS